MIDATIVFLFIAVTLMAGFGHGRKITTLEQYALGDRSFSTWTLVATIVATLIGGSTFMIGLTKTYSSGLSYVLPSSAGRFLSILVLAYIFIPRMSVFLGKLSLAEVIGDLYGKRIRIVVAIAGTIGTAGAIAVQFKVFGFILGYITDIPNYYCIILSAFIVTFYSAFGGIRAVTFTDMVQIIMFGVAIPVILITIWNYTLGEGIYIMDATDVDKFNIYTLLPKNNPGFWSMFAYFLYVMIPSIKPAMFQRVSMGRDIHQVKKAFAISAFIILIIKISIQWVPFLVFSVKPDVESKELLSFIMNTFAYPGLSGLIICGVIAMAMSTADSNINASSVLIANDICKPLNIGAGRELMISKICSFLLGGLGILMALSEQDLLKIILRANAFYMPVVTVPLMLTILGFRSTTFSIGCGIFVGFSTVILWKYVFILKPDPIVFAMLMNFIVTMAVHYLTGQNKQKDKGWVAVPKVQKTKHVGPTWWDDVKKFFEINPLNFITECAKKAPIKETAYGSLGLYLVMFTLMTMYNTQNTLYQNGIFEYASGYAIMMGCSTIMLSYPIWPLSVSWDLKEKIAAYLWPTIIFIMLVLFNIFFAVISNFAGFQLAIFSINLLLAVMLIGWRIGMQLIITGALIIAWLYNYWHLDDAVHLSIDSPITALLYVLMIIFASIALFLRPQQNHTEEVESDSARIKQRMLETVEELNTAKSVKSKFLQVIQHETNLPLSFIAGISFLVEGRKEGKEIPPEHIDTVFNAIESGSERLQIMMGNMLKTANFERGVAEFNFKQADIVKTTKEVMAQFSDKIEINWNINTDEKLIINHDHVQIKTVLHNLFKDVYWYVESKKCDLVIEQSEKEATFKVVSPNNPLQDGEKEHLFEMFYQGYNGQQRQKGVGLGLYLCKKIIEMHGGKIWVDTTTDSFTVCFTLPK